MKYHIDISIQTLDTLKHSLCCELFLLLDCCPPIVLFNSLDMIGKGTHLSIYRSHSWHCLSEQKPSHEVKSTACRAFRLGLCWGTDLGKGYTKTLSDIEGSQQLTMASIILRCKPKIWGRPGLFLQLAFQQDNVPIHTSKTMQEWLRDN